MACLTEYFSPVMMKAILMSMSRIWFSRVLRKRSMRGLPLRSSLMKKLGRPASAESSGLILLK